MADDPHMPPLKGPYRSLYLAARRVEAEEQTEIAEPATAPETPAHAETRSQVATLLQDIDITEDDRQRLLANIMCPCCGGIGTSFAFDLKPTRKAGF